MNGYLDSNGNYYEGDRQGQDRVVPQRPSPDHYPVFDVDGFTFVEWVHDPARNKAALGKIPTNEFIATVFAPPADMVDPDPQYTWNREGQVRFASKQVDVRMPKDGYLAGTRAEVMQMAGWMMTYKQIPNTYPPVYEALVPDENGVYTGGIISMEEYGRVIALLNEYGVQ